MKVNYSTFLNGELLTKLILGLIAINIIGYGYNKNYIHDQWERLHFYVDKLKGNICK